VINISKEGIIEAMRDRFVLCCLLVVMTCCLLVQTIQVVKMERRYQRFEQEMEENIREEEERRERMMDEMERDMRLWD